jgi:hypothetical protein
MRVKPNILLIPRRKFEDIPTGTLKGILKELRAGRSVGATGRMFDTRESFVTRIRDDAGIPVKRDGSSRNKMPDPIK